MLCLVIVATFYTKIDQVLLLWIAFVLTRPFGATFGDLLAKPIAKGGLNFSTVGSFLILASLLITFIAYMTLRDKRLSHELQAL